MQHGANRKSAGEGVSLLAPNNHVQIIETEASIRCGLTLSTVYELVVEPCEIVLQRDHKVLFVWPFKHIRRYGYTNNSFSIEAGSKCLTGEGLFIFRSPKSIQLYNQTIANVAKLKQLKMRQLMQRSFDTLQGCEGALHSSDSEVHRQSCELGKLGLGPNAISRHSACNMTVPHYVRNECEYAQVVKQRSGRTASRDQNLINVDHLTPDMHTNR